MLAEQYRQTLEIERGNAITGDSLEGDDSAETDISDDSDD